MHKARLAVPLNVHNKPYISEELNIIVKDNHVLVILWPLYVWCIVCCPPFLCYVSFR